MAASNINKRSIESREVEDLIKYLRDGDKRTVANDKIFLVLGVTGTGKSTFVQYIAGDNTKLQSIELGEDSGDFIIVDDGRISNSTSESKTIIPELMYDPKTDTNFYDCPGFSDTRSTNIDITATYLIKKLISRSKSIKIAFVISYPSVRKGVDRISFMEFVTHAITLIKDVRKYSNSIALIVTKVDNETVRRRGTFQLVPDSTIIRKIGDFLVEVRDEQQKKYESLGQNVSQEEKKFFEQAINFINILALKKDNKYDRIAIFRRPDEPGPLSEVVLLQEGKVKIMGLLHNRLTYTSVNPSDFGYTISDKSKNHIYEITEYLNKEIQNSVRLVINEVVSVYETNIKKYLDNFQIIKDKINVHYLFIIETIKKIDGNTTVENFLLLLLQLLDDIEIQLSESDFKDIVDLNSYLNFLQMFRKNNVKSLGYGWKETLNDFENSVQGWKVWISFLFKVNAFISEYKVQKNPILMSDISKAFTNNTYKIFLKESDMFDKQILDDLNRIKINELMKSMLHQLIIARMQAKVEKECLGSNKVRIQGEFVKFSEINSVQCWSSNVNRVEFFASDTIYIDADFVASKKMHIVIFAPTWIIVGKRKIILDGNHGVSHSTSRARSGSYPSGNGYHGLPGRHGKSGGIFLGLGMKFIDGENLQITANGGNGGPGQDGGDGASGRNGEQVHVPHGRAFNSCPHSNFDVDNGHFIPVEDPTLDVYAVFGGVVGRIYDGYGNGATEGGTGGNGGVGGLGGEPGTVKLIELKKKSGIKIEMNEGKKGRSGNGGAGGQGGYNSKTRVKCQTKIALFVIWTEWSIINTDKYYDKKFNGLRGGSGINNYNQEQLESRTLIENSTDIFQHCKEFVQKSLRNFNKEYLVHFLQEMELNNNGKKISDGSLAKKQETSKQKVSYYNKLRTELTLKQQEQQQLRQKRSVQLESFNFMNVPSSYNINLILNSSISSKHISTVNYEYAHIPVSYNVPINQPEINSSILLADVIIKKITKRKYLPYNKCSEIRTDIAQALTLNILNEYENILSETFCEEDLIEYNPIEMQTKIFNFIMSNQCKEIFKYLIKSVALFCDKSNSFEKFSEKIDQMLQKFF